VLAFGLASTVAADTSPDVAPSQIEVVPVSAAPPADVVVANRVICTFRSDLLGYSPAARAAAATERIEAILESSETGEVAATTLDTSVLVTIGDKLAFAITPGDVDVLAGQTQEQATAQAVRRLSQALAEARELRQPGRLMRAVTLAAVAALLFVGLLAVLRRVRHSVERWLAARAEAGAERLVFKGFAPLAGGNAQSLSRLAVRLAGWCIALFATYVWLTFELERFPYTRPWGEQLGTFLVEALGKLLAGVVAGVPGLVMALLILALARGAVWLVNSFFRGIDEGRIEAPASVQETSQPTRRIAVAAIWLFAVVMAYPYLPGSDSAAFKGMSVFVGLMATLGGSSLFGQAVSGLVLMYSRSLKAGDYVRIDEHEGTVTSLGMLATKIRTPKDEEISVPNSVLVGTVTKNYSRLAQERGVILHTSVTIGYDTPWRQVHAMLVAAAGRTPGLRKDPPPFVWQWALSDFYVEYQLNARLERPEDRQPVMVALHANIQDAFNEYGVQIMSPHFVFNPAEKVWVPRERWHEAPAEMPAQAGDRTAGDGERG
jgi:small-conductance mechanosensitive channel